MITFQSYFPGKPISEDLKDQIADFLVKELGKFGDPKEDVLKCLAYVFGQNTPGGFVILAMEKSEIRGVLIMNKTGMSGYIPENILVYIAVDASKRGSGIGLKLMSLAIESSDGAIALHMEADNPARRLYERLGFTNKYLEMRLVK
ncbi:MAG: GNAT family N-acetyltransferase [Algoriphagus sp.]|nr:GNAT family N-acetyltransferase [Algoriphagus sp.]